MGSRGLATPGQGQRDRSLAEVAYAVYSFREIAHPRIVERPPGPKPHIMLKRPELRSWNVTVELSDRRVQ